MLPVANAINMIADLAVYNKLMVQARKTILAMESEGGMTSSLYSALQSGLQAGGIDTSKLTVSASPAPVPYGSEIYLDISYQRPVVRFHLLGIFLQRRQEAAAMRVGPLRGISKRYIR
jgi:hypothetical protein